MLSQNIKMRIELICYATVSGYFSSMINVKYRGERFAWNSFAGLIKAHCKDQVYMAMPYSAYKRRKKDIDAYAEKFSSAIARDMMQNAGVTEWMPYIEGGNSNE